MRTRSIIISSIVITIITGGILLAQNFATIRVIYQIPAMEKVIIKEDLVYKTRDGKDLTFDLTYPPDFKGDVKPPVVINVLGYADDVFKGPLKNWELYKDWAKIFASSGMAAVNYSTLHPASDIHDLILHIRENAEELNLNGDAIGIWSCSGNVVNALSVIMDDRKDFLKCAVLYYGIMATPDKKFHETVTKFSEMVKFSVDGIDKIKYFHKNLPIMIVRAGKDTKDINQTIDHYVSQAIANNVPLTFVNYGEGHHAFDVMDDNDRSREIIQQTLDFMKSNLLSR